MVSVVMPTLNEAPCLPETLRLLLQQDGIYEVLVVDGGSEDETVTIAQSHPEVQVLTARRGRAMQMNAGAAEARGEWLLFLHADTWLPAGAIARLNSCEDDPTIQAGGFQHQFTGHDWRLRLISSLNNFRCRQSAIIYGDQALFIRRRLFHNLGGFPEQPFLEDVALGARLLEVTRPVLWVPPVITDARKFLKMGIWRSFARVLLIILHMQFGRGPFPRAFFQAIR